MGWVGKGREKKIREYGEGFVRGKRREDVGVGGKGWEISTHMLRYLLQNVEN